MKLLEITLWALGVTLATAYVASRAEGESERQLGIARFGEQHQPTAAIANHAPGASATELARHAEAIAAAAVVPPVAVLAVLRIQRVDLEVPVKYGTGEEVLDGAAGLIEGTARPDEPGNIAIAAHRDTLFRALEDVVLGDLIEIETAGGIRSYRVVALSVVDPEDVDVLENTGVDQVTLVTCFPFRYFGSAPQRFIVRADETTLI